MDDMTVEQLEELAAKQGMALVPRAEFEQLFRAQVEVDMTALLGGTWR